MALTQQQRDERRSKKAAKLGVEDLRMKAAKGTNQALAEIMQWASVEEKGEAMTLMIHRIHELGQEAAIHFLSAPLHKIEITPAVARKLDQFRISRELREPDILLGDDPEDDGVFLIGQGR